MAKPSGGEIHGYDGTSDSVPIFISPGYYIPESLLKRINERPLMNPETRWSDADQRDLDDADIREQVAEAIGIDVAGVDADVVRDYFQDPDDWGTDR